MAGVFLKTEVAAVCVQLAFPRKYVVLFREVLFANKFLSGYNIIFKIIGEFRLSL